MDYQLEQSELSKFFNYYSDLANKRVPWAQSWIADAYFWGWGVQQDFQSFIKWDTKAARNGSLTSARRMFLYYFSIGSKEASATLCTKKLEGSTDNILKSKAWSNNVNDFLRLYDNKNTLEMISSYENALDVDDEKYKSDYIGWRKKHSLLLYAICYIYGFGVEPNYEKGMDYILKCEVPNQEEDYWDIDMNFIHYYLCLREINIPGDERFENAVFEKSSYKYSFFDENEMEAYKVRHFVRRALMDDINSAESLGREIMEASDKVDNKRRRLFYHDDGTALYYLSKAAGVNPLSFATYDAITLSSNPYLKTFNYQYAKNLLIGVDEKIDNAIEKDSGCHDKLLVRRHIARGLADLARASQNFEEKRDFGNRALRQCEKYSQEYIQKYSDSEELSYELGKIYFDCFNDYNIALRYFNKIENPVDEIVRYKKECKKNGARV